MLAVGKCKFRSALPLSIYHIQYSVFFQKRTSKAGNLLRSCHPATLSLSVHRLQGRQQTGHEISHLLLCTSVLELHAQDTISVGNTSGRSTGHDTAAISRRGRVRLFEQRQGT